MEIIEAEPALKVPLTALQKLEEKHSPDVLLHKFRVERQLKLAEPEVPNPNIFFDVDIRPLEAITGVPDGGQQAVVKLRDGEVSRIVAVHGGAYKLTKNQDVFGAVGSALGCTEGLDMNDMRIFDQVSGFGGKTIRSYIFPEHRIKIGENDETNLRINVLNSYDGSTNLRIFTGGYRLVCKNGMIIGNDVSSFATRHTGSFDYHDISRRLAHSVSLFFSNAERWHKWSMQTCTDAQAAKVIEQIADGGQKVFEFLYAAWLDEKGNMGPTVWALYNAMTYWSTHYDVKAGSEANRASVVFTRENKVGKTLRLPIFTEAA